MQNFSLLGFAAHCFAMQRDLHEMGPAVVERACRTVHAEARRVLGTHDYDWPPLSPATIARKAKGDTPLLETGELRDSIEWWSKGNEGAVGSNNDKAVWMELGTSRVPPRSFLVEAAVRKEPEIHKMAERAIIDVVTGKGRYVSGTRALVGLVRDLGRTIKDSAYDLATYQVD